MHATAVRRLTGNVHMNEEFATQWPEYDLDPKTRALLAFAKKVTEKPYLMEDDDITSLKQAGWDDAGIYEATALISFFNFTGRMEAVSGLPGDQIPEHASFREAQQ